MKAIQLDHVALHVSDVEQSGRFYETVLQLERIPRPAFRFPGAWYRLGTQQELHLIGERTRPVHSHSRGDHFALLVEDLSPWETHFHNLGIDFEPRRTRPDGALQIYVTDPDGHVIELCMLPAS